MPDFVRIRTESGSEVTVTRQYAAACDVTPLDKPAVDAYGRVLPQKPRVRLARASATPSAEAPAEAPSRKGTSSKENNR
jgi:hypothetical protein